MSTDVVGWPLESGFPCRLILRWCGRLVVSVMDVVVPSQRAKVSVLMISESWLAHEKSLMKLSWPKAAYDEKSKSIAKRNCFIPWIFDCEANIICWKKNLERLQSTEKESRKRYELEKKYERWHCCFKNGDRILYFGYQGVTAVIFLCFRCGNPLIAVMKGFPYCCLFPGFCYSKNNKLQ